MDQVDKELDTLKNKESDLIKQLGKFGEEANKMLAEWKNVVKEGGKIPESFGKAADELAKNQAKARAELKQTQKSIASLSAQAKNTESAIIAGTATKKLTTEMRSLREEISRLEMAGETNSQRFIDLSVRAAQLQDQIGDTQAQIRALASDTRNLDAALSLGQGLTGSFTAATSIMALFGGESEELQRAFFKVQAALQALNGIQMVANTLNKDSVANVILKNAMSKLFTKTTIQETAAITADTVATGANTAATGAATVATKLWTKALLANPVFWIAAVIMGVVFAISKLVGSMKSQVEKQMELNELEKIHLGYLQQTDALAKKMSDREIARLSNELELMKARGSTEEQQSIQRKRILSEEQKFADDQTKRYEADIAKINQTERELKGLYTILEQLNVLQEKNKKNSIVTFESGEKLKGKTKDLIETIQGMIDNTEIRLNLAIDADKAQEEVKVKQEKAAQDEITRMRKDAATIAQIRVDAAKKGSNEELNARIALVEKQRQISLAAEGLSYADRKKINYEANEAIKKDREDFEKQKLQDERAGIEAQLALTKEGSEREYQLRNALLKNQLDESLTNRKLTENEAEKIYNEYLKAVKKLQDDYNKQSSEDALNIQLSTLNAQLSAAEKGGEEELNLRKKILEKQAELERNSILTSTMNEELKNAKILELDAKLKAELLQNQKDYDQKVIDNILQSTQTEIEAERIKNEKILTSGNFIDRIKARNELKKLEIDSVNAEMNALDAARQLDLVNEQQYLQRKAELQNDYAALELEALKEQQANIDAIKQQAFDFGVSLIMGSFDAEKQALQSQLDNLKNYYTTDAEEAKKNANLKLVSEEYLAQKENEIKKKMAENDRDKAAYEATINAFAGAAKALPNLVLSGIVLAFGLAQALKIKTAKLPAYAKGLKGNKGKKGHFAKVGELGPETMWIPEGASIIPNNKSKNITPDVLREFNINIPELPAMPNVKTPKQINEYYGSPVRIDYNKMGKAVADNIQIPEVSQWNVNIDERGWEKYQQKRGSTTRLLNTRYRLN